MIDKNKYRELDALTAITINRILEQVTGDIRKSKIKSLDIFHGLKNKWTSQVKDLYLNIYNDFQVQYQNSLANSK